jgi:preprotein translocase subunit SecA
MFNKIVSAIVGSSSKRELKEYHATILEINQLWEEYKELDEEELIGKTEEFRQRLQDGETLEDIKVEAFTTVREACRRLKEQGAKWDVRGKEITWDMVQYDCQMIGGLCLHHGKIAEMATGEGKTLVAVAPLYLNALEGGGAHLVTVNDYLAQRDSEWMGGVFRYLGMTVGIIVSDMEPEERRASYACDITYGTNNEFGFDYLRDNMAVVKDNMVQSEYRYAIIDEVDSVLIDEARTPLIISGQVDRSNAEYELMKPHVQKLVKKQNQLVNEIMVEMRETKKKLADMKPGTEEYKDTERLVGYNLVKARKGLPKQKALQKALQDVSNVKLMEKVEREVMAAKAMPELEEELYYVVDEKGHTIDMTDKAREFIAPSNPDQFVLTDIVDEYATIEAKTNLSDEEKAQEKEKVRVEMEAKQEKLHSISQLLRAYSLYENDTDYLIQDGKIVIIDEHTGRQMPGRRWSDGLHQAVEAKEGLKVEAESQTLATITLQNYFRMYDKLAGMTGTAVTEAQEFSHTYDMAVMEIPTNRPIARDDQDDWIFRTKREKYAAIIEEVEELHKKQLPVLIGTKTVDVSELLSKMLKRRKISHNVLNAKYHERESEIVAGAGQPGAVTIATNMAGRGTDIKLGQGVIREEDGEKEGGLQIIGTERHDSRRIDRQLRGRAGRQGDPGASRFYVSLEDDLMRLFGSDRIASLMSRMGMEEGEMIQHKWLTRSIESAQKKVENRNFDVRKRTLEFDDVMNKQRGEIYSIRRQVLFCEDIEEIQSKLIEMVMNGLETVFPDYGDPDEKPATWDIKGFRDYLKRHNPYAELDDLEAPTDMSPEDAYDELFNDVEQRMTAAYEKKREMLGDGLSLSLTRRVILMTIDADWRDHLAAIDELRENIWTQAYSQKEPIVEYRRIASVMFADLLDDIYKEIFRHFFLTQVVLHQPQNQAAPRVFFQKQSPEEAAAEMDRQQAARQGQQQSQQERPPKQQTVKHDTPKVGRNEPCPCGSGKKYKNCCGRKQLAETKVNPDPSFINKLR